MADFKQIPSLEQVANRVRQLHKAISDLSRAMGLEVRQIQDTLEGSTKITDQVLEEMALQIAFIMQSISLAKPLHGGIADANGKVPMEKRTLSQVYAESGRAKLIQQIAEAKRAQGLSTAESAPQANGKAPSAAEDGAAATNAAANLPKLITHCRR